jgi:hypothetical protein
MKSFRPKDDPGSSGCSSGTRNPEINFRGERRKNNTHCSMTDPDARLYRIPVVLHGTRTHGEPKRAGYQFPGHECRWNNRAKGRLRDGKSHSWKAPHHTCR